MNPNDERFTELESRFDELETSHNLLLRLVVGGLNTETGKVEVGIAQQLADAVKELSHVSASVASFVTGLKSFGTILGRWALGVIGFGFLTLFGWIVHNWPMLSPIVFGHAASAP